MDMQSVALDGTDPPDHPVVDLDRQAARKIIAPVFDDTLLRPGHDVAPFFLFYAIQYSGNGCN